MENKKKELEDQLQRLRAELVNMERRLTGQILKAREQGREEAVLGLLPVYDHLERAFAHLTEEAETEAAKSPALAQWLEGMKGMPGELERRFNEVGVEKIESDGQIFSAEKHESIAGECDEAKEDGIILQTVKTGWQTRDERLIRPASVIVNDNPNYKP